MSERVIWALVAFTVLRTNSSPPPPPLATAPSLQLYRGFEFCCFRWLAKSLLRLLTMAPPYWAALEVREGMKSSSNDSTSSTAITAELASSSRPEDNGADGGTTRGGAIDIILGKWNRG
uniref:Putative secreted protein n=1 Tax=Anopheles darlingi TaxID=43151 RepID=A0A2M4D408_ANODA